VRAVLVPHYDQRRAVLVVRMRRNAHNPSRVLEIEQRLVKRNAIFGRRG
jgi:hypothetical protein